MKRAIAVLVAAMLSVPALASAASLNLKPGLWQIHSNMKRSGTPPIPDSVLAKLSPEQRTKLEAALKARLEKQPSESVTKTCITKEQLAKKIPMDPAARNKACKSTLVKSSSSMQMIHVVCSGPQSVVGDWTVQAIDSKSMMGTIDMKISAGTKTMTMNGKFDGKWLQASCPAPHAAPAAPK